jgi:hypothetical protein
MSECVEAGDSISVAAEKVTRALRTGRRDLRDLKPPTVKNWRDRLEAGPGPGAPDEAIKHYKEPLPPGLGTTPRQRADNLLKILAERGSQLG